MSKSNKHTPGPWSLESDGSIVMGNQVVGTAPSPDTAGKEETTANARLIAAAPDGHDILLLLKRFIDEGATQISFGALMDTDDTTPLSEAVSAYFAKAIGGAE